MIDRNCVHTFSQGGRFFAVDGNSGAVHELDETAFAVVSRVQQGGNLEPAALTGDLQQHYPAAEVLEAVEDVQDLVDQGVLFSEDVTEVPPRQQPVVKALCLNVAHDCDLRCTYCFAATGGFGGQRELMSQATAEHAVDFLIQASHTREQLEVDFFGGEPLLNFDVVKATVAYGQEQAAKHGKQIRFTMTTNGIGLDEDVQNFCNEKMYNVVLSIDGRKATNDRLRRLSYGGESVHDQIVPKYQDFVRARGSKSYYVRGTFTRHNLDFANDVSHLVDLGFNQVSMEPVVAQETLDYALTTEDLPRILQEYEALAEMFLQSKRPFQFFHFNVELRKGPCLHKRLSGCGAGHEYLAVTPDGSLYPCHQFIGQPQYQMGDVFSGMNRSDLQAKLQDAHVLNKPECVTCWAKYYCSGGCHANNLAFRGSLFAPYQMTCAMERKRLECSFYLYASQQTDGR